MSRCRTTGKIKRTRDEAVDKAAELMALWSDHGTRPLNVYQCVDCETWHVGHRPKVLPKDRPAPIEKPVFRALGDGPRCDVPICKKLPATTVMTPTGEKHVCKVHAKQFKRAYGGHP